MSDKLSMSREQMFDELAKCGATISRVLFAEHVLRIGTIALREENKSLRSGEFICCKCLLRKDAENFFKDGVPF